MSQRVQGHVLLSQTGVVVAGVSEVDSESSFERVATEPSPADRWEERIIGVPGALGEPDAQHSGGGAGQWRDPLFASFAFTGDVRGATGLEVGDVEGGELGGAQPGLGSEQEQRVVAAPGPGGAVGRGEQHGDLLWLEEGDDRSVGAFGRDREHPLDVVGVLGVTQRQVAKQRVDRGQASVAGAGTVATVGLEVIQERGDRAGVQVGDIQLRRLATGTGGGEPDQQLDRVAIGGDRVRTGVAFADQPLREERL